jgi:hypothetical protein
MTNLDRSVAVMLKNTVEGLEQANAPLKHVYFTLGLKYYGQQHWDHAHASEAAHPQSRCFLDVQEATDSMWQQDIPCRAERLHKQCVQPAGVHWGPTKAPFDEDDPRHLPPN